MPRLGVCVANVKRDVVVTVVNGEGGGGNEGEAGGVKPLFYNPTISVRGQILTY